MTFRDTTKRQQQCRRYFTKVKRELPPPSYHQSHHWQRLSTIHGWNLGCSTCVALKTLRSSLIHEVWQHQQTHYVYTVKSAEYTNGNCLIRPLSCRHAHTPSINTGGQWLTSLPLLHSAWSASGWWRTLLCWLPWRIQMSLSCSLLAGCTPCSHRRTKVTQCIVEHLYRGHLSNEDTVCCPNHIELCTNLPLN